jgi:uncharacterized RDD family membrane protein YckC
MVTAAGVSEIRVASLGDRLVGQFADGLIAFLPLMVVGLIVGMLTGRDPFGVIFLAVMGFAAFYLWFADGFEGGQSYGKRMVHIRVIDYTTHEPCTFWQSFIRNVLLTILGPLDWIFIFGTEHRRLGDYAAGTVVIDARS